MYCTQCGMELRATDRYCSQCGARTAINLPPVTAPRPLMLDKANKKIAGVCSGFARYLEVDATLIRVIWLILAFGTGVGFIAYIVAWIAMPSDHGEWRPAWTPEVQKS